jgi:hypothetical protein
MMPIEVKKCQFMTGQKLKLENTYMTAFGDLPRRWRDVFQPPKP